MSNSKVRARRRRRANKAWKKVMGFVVFTETPADPDMVYGLEITDWARAVVKAWAEKGLLP